MAALGWLLNLGFAGGGVAGDAVVRYVPKRDYERLLDRDYEHYVPKRAYELDNSDPTERG